MTREMIRRRGAVGSLTVVVLSLLAAGCTQSQAESPEPERTSSVDSETALNQMIAAVDDATKRLGGEWHKETGPRYAEDCELPDGGQGAQWRYLVTRPSVGDVAKDVAGMEERWKQQAMTIDHWGTEEEPTIVGRGGDRTKSISLSVAKNLYGVEAISVCFTGDADDL